MASLPRFPTELHQTVAEFATHFFLGRPLVDTVLVVNSCARGQVTPASDLDLAVLVSACATAEQLQGLEASWQEFMATEPLLRQFKHGSRFAQVHLDVFNGEFTPGVWDAGGGPDSFEVEIGNRIAHSAPMREAGPYFRQLQSRWLPYYDNDLRLRRLTMAREACAYDLEHVPHCLTRGLYFQAFDRLYKAFQEFLQGLFISHGIYPVAYNKWVREQVEGWLGLPELYQELPAILSVRNLESTELSEKADALRIVLERWVRP
jgi:predicted nucleotidyltransferase